MSLNLKKISDSSRTLYTNEGGGLVPVWNHLIKIESISEGSCLYADDVDIEAGLLTPIVWFYAHAFYRYRQWRWRALLKK